MPAWSAKLNTSAMAPPVSDSMPVKVVASSSLPAPSAVSDQLWSTSAPSRVSASAPPSMLAGTVSPISSNRSAPPRPCTSMRWTPASALPNRAIKAPAVRSTITPPSLAVPTWRTSIWSAPSVPCTCSKPAAPRLANGSPDSSTRASSASRTSLRRNGGRAASGLIEALVRRCNKRPKRDVVFMQTPLSGRRERQQIRSGPLSHRVADASRPDPKGCVNRRAWYPGPTITRSRWGCELQCLNVHPLVSTGGWVGLRAPTLHLPADQGQARQQQQRHGRLGHGRQDRDAHVLQRGRVGVFGFIDVGQHVVTTE